MTDSLQSPRDARESSVRVLIERAASCAISRDWQAAENIYRRLNALEPDDGGHRWGIAAALYNQGRYPEALEAFEAMDTTGVQDVPVWLNLCACLLALGRLEEAALRLKRWVTLAPGDQRVCQTLGFMLMHLHDRVGAEKVIRDMMSTFPENEPMRSLAGKHYLRCADYARGFDYYRSRWIREPHMQPSRDLACDTWDGARFAGTLLIAAEKALGEEILASSMFPDLIAMGQAAIIECDERLLPVFRRSFPALTFVVRGQGHLRAIVQAGDPASFRKLDAGDLGYHFRRQGGFPARGGWLKPDAARLEAIKARHRQRSGRRFRVGVAWKSTRSAEHVNLSKSLGLRPFAALLAHPGVTGVSLQHGEIGADLDTFRAELKMDLQVDPDIDPNRDIEGLLAQVASMDLVVSCSNSVVHLAGALGVPCWLVLRRKQFLVWYWGYQGSRCAFYPSLEIFRADPQLSDREGIDRVFSLLRARLDILCEEHVAGPTDFDRDDTDDGRPSVLRRARGLLVRHRPEEASRLMASAWEGIGDDVGSLLAAAALCRNLHDWQTTEHIMRRVVELAPGAGYEAGLAYALFSQKKYAEGAAWFDRHLEHRPGDLVATLNASLCLTRLGRHEEAVARLRRARTFAMDESLFEILCQVLIQLGEREAAENAIDDALAAFPDSAVLTGIAGKHYLRCGDHARGFDLNRRRWLGYPKAQPSLALPCPAWDGRPFNGTLLIAAEQGLGDEILTASLFDDLREMGQRALIECDARLVTLFRRSFPDARFVQRGHGLLRAAMGQEDPSAFRKVDAGDLFYHFRRNGTFPARPGWLVPDKDLVTGIRDRYQQQFGGKLRVGIGWKSFRPRMDEGYEKNIDLNAFAPLLKRDDVVGINLQYGDVDEDIARFERETGATLYRDPVIDPSHAIDAQAAQIAALDVVISTSNSAVHLAGALGRPCWLLLRKKQPLMWYWGYPGVPCPWYSSIEIFRIPHPPGEPERIDRVISGLSARLDALGAGLSSER